MYDLYSSELIVGADNNCSDMVIASINIMFQLIQLNQYLFLKIILLILELLLGNVLIHHQTYYH